MAFTPRHEQITGASLNGSSGDANRTYTLAYDDAILAQMSIIVSENASQSTINFTLDTDTNVITFLGIIFDEQPITIDYFTTDASSSLGSYYCTTLDIVRASGIGVEVFSETLGTGDDLTASFDFDNGNIIDGSYSLYYGASGSNSFTSLIETTHYTINKDRGTIVLTASGITELTTNVLYADYVYSPRHSDTLLATYLAATVREVDRLTNNSWGSVTSATQYFDGYTSGYPQTDEPYGEQIEDYPEFTLKYKGVTAITSIKFLDRQGTVTRTLDSTEYRILTEDTDSNFQDSRLLINTTIPNGKANIQVIYTHGYSTIPELIRELASYVAGTMALVNISGGSYKDVSTYTLGRKSFSIGQIYVNIRESIDQLQSRIDNITLLMGGNYGCE